MATRVEHHLVDERDFESLTKVDDEGAAARPMRVTDLAAIAAVVPVEIDAVCLGGPYLFSERRLAV